MNKVLIFHILLNFLPFENLYFVLLQPVLLSAILVEHGEKVAIVQLNWSHFSSIVDQSVFREMSARTLSGFPFLTNSSCFLSPYFSAPRCGWS